MRRIAGGMKRRLTRNVSIAILRSFARTITVPYDYESDISPLTLDSVEDDEEEDLYSPTYPIPVTEQSDIDPFHSSSWPRHVNNFHLDTRRPPMTPR
ncbi:hypothetical protein CEP54_001198 [Fusarium duplospermum]|uniref:Uncharacterized protein n=1 Tax=Fusarium duplospermum TaxID=1325734 RepID=A0A428R252_9HYPO|nr:hypothetical protein CEP54_001198 [Fusarium duplospermum]